VKQAIGVIVNRQFASSGFYRPAVQLDDGTWYWLSEPCGAPQAGQTVRIRYVEGDQFCELLDDELAAAAQ